MTAAEETDAVIIEVLESAYDALCVDLERTRLENTLLKAAVNDMSTGMLTMHLDHKGWFPKRHPSGWTGPHYPSALEAVLAMERDG